MRRNWHDWLGRLLILALFLIEIPRYRNTLPDQDERVALGMGIFVAGAAFFCVESWGMLKRQGQRARLNWLGWMIVVQIALVPIIMTPPFVAQQRGIALTELLSDIPLWIWTTIVTATPVVVGGMTAFAISLQYTKSELTPHTKQVDDQQVLALKAEVTALRAEMSEQREQARLLEASTELASNEHVCQYCKEWSGRTLQALRAHESWCEDNPNGRKAVEQRGENHREPVAVGEDYSNV